MRKGSASLKLLLSLASLAVLLTACPSQQPGSNSTPQTIAANTPATPASPGAPPAQTASPAATATPAGSASPQATPATSGTPAVKADLLAPLPGKTPAPITEIKRVKVTTTAGDFVMEVYPQAAPHAAERFLTLVKEGFYDNTAVGRVVKQPEPFVAQFGINPNKAHWKEKNFDDDPSLYQLLPGTVCFAKAGANHNSTQVFINYKDNSFLATPEYNFAVFGKVVKGMDIVEKFASVGDPSGGLDQEALWTNPDYVEGLPEKPTMITSIKAVP
jgi:cyclophilin family peptidyl-prolyl cis-trans isomerase